MKNKSVFTVCLIALVGLTAACGKESEFQKSSDARIQSLKPSTGSEESLENPNGKDNSAALALVEASRIVELFKGTSWEGPVDDNGKLVGESNTIKFDSVQNSFTYKGASFPFEVMVGPNLDGDIYLMNPGTEFTANKMSIPLAIVRSENGKLSLLRGVRLEIRMNRSGTSRTIIIEPYRQL